MNTVIEDRPHAREGRVFKAYRIMANITQRNLGKDLGIPTRMIQEYEQGRCMPGPDRLIMLVNRLGIPMDALSPAVASESPERETAC